MLWWASCHPEEPSLWIGKRFEWLLKAPIMLPCAMHEWVGTSRCMEACYPMLRCAVHIF